MSLREVPLGRPIPDEEADEQKLGVASGVPVLGLDAAYGPEAALTVLIPLGAAGLRFLAPVTAAVVALLFLVQLSHRQTIAAYPDGRGSFSVARANLGRNAALLAAAALALDYVPNVAVAISAGVGALVSAVPALGRHTLALCLVLLAGRSSRCSDPPSSSASPRRCSRAALPARRSRRRTSCPRPRRSGSGSRCTRSRAAAPR